MIFFKKEFKNSLLPHTKQAVPITLSQKCIIMTDDLWMSPVYLNNSGNLIEPCALYTRQLRNTEDRIALGVSTYEEQRFESTRTFRIFIYSFILFHFTFQPQSSLPALLPPPHLPSPSLPSTELFVIFTVPVLKIS